MKSVARLPDPPTLSLLFAATAWGTIWYPLRLLEQAGLQGAWATLVMYVAATLVGLKLTRSWRRDWAQAPHILLAIMLAAGWCNTAFIVAVIEGHVVRVILLFYLSPIWTVLFAHFLLGERLTQAALQVLAIAFVGAMLMLWSPEIGLPLPSDWADWLAITAGIGFALTNVMARKGHHLAVGSKTLATWAGGVLVAGVWVLVARLGMPEVTAWTWLGSLLLGGIGIVLMTLAVIHGVSSMPAQRSAVILLFELVAAAISAALLANESITLREWIGGGMIITAAYLAERR